MESTANLQMPYIMPSQAQKHVTHNEALAMLDAIVQLSVHDRDLTAPPGGESEGDRYIVASGASGAWEGWDGAVALRTGDGWWRIDPKVGWLAWVEDEAVLVFWTGSAWSEATGTQTPLQNLSLLGVGTAADAENPFAAKLNKALWTAKYDGEGGDGDLRYTLNKEAPAGTLSLLMQSDWSARAEIGLLGDDDLSIKVSSDGSGWKEAVRLDRSSGAARFPHTAALDAVSGLTGAPGSFARFTGADTAAMQAIVGTVSQSGGTPTGAIVESGSNANGNYTRFADGTQLCWQKGVTFTYASAAIVRYIWTFPAAFIDTNTFAMGQLPAVTTAYTNSSRRRFLANLWGGLTTTGVTLNFVTIEGAPAMDETSQVVDGRVMAIGRWF